MKAEPAEQQTVASQDAAKSKKTRRGTGGISSQFRVMCRFMESKASLNSSSSSSSSSVTGRLVTRQATATKARAMSSARAEATQSRLIWVQEGRLCCIQRLVV